MRTADRKRPRDTEAAIGLHPGRTRRAIDPARLLLLTVLAGALPAAGQPSAATAADSGWIALCNGKNLDGFNLFLNGAGLVPPAGHAEYDIDSGMIHAPTGSNGHLVTAKEYGYYRVRVDYRFGPETGIENAGLVIHFDLQQAASLKNVSRPRSIEVNIRKEENSVWTLWAAAQLGPYITTTVKSGTQSTANPAYLPAADGGVDFTADPWGSRVIYSALPNADKPKGQWNHGEASIHGDSGSFRLNGQLRCAGWGFQARVNAGNPTPRVRYGRGAIALQSEGHQIWYRNFEIMELDSATGAPLHARRGCTARGDSRYDPRAVIDDGNCAATGTRGGIPASGLFRAFGSRSMLSFEIRKPGPYALEVFDASGAKVAAYAGRGPESQVLSLGRAGVFAVRFRSPHGSGTSLAMVR
jgi:hypothetical protein